LPSLTDYNQGIFIWFLMGFPSILVGLFFLILNWNHTVLYAPSDYKDDKTFLAILLEKNQFNAPAATKFMTVASSSPARVIVSGEEYEDPPLKDE